MLLVRMVGLMGLHSPLPKPLAGTRGVTVMSQFYITGEFHHQYYGHVIINCLCYKVEYTRGVVETNMKISQIFMLTYVSMYMRFT